MALDKKAIIVIVIIAVLVAGGLGYFVIYPKLNSDDDDDDDGGGGGGPIGNHRPVANFKMEYEGMKAFVGDTITFNASQSSDADGDVLSYFWDFNGEVDENGDGDPENDNEAQGEIVDHVFQTNGSYWIVLTVNDTIASDPKKSPLEVFEYMEDPEAILTPWGTGGVITQKQYHVTIGSISPLYLAANYSIEIYGVDGDNYTVLYVNPVGNLTGDVSFNDVDSDGFMSQGDTFTMIPSDDLPVKDQDIFFLVYDITGDYSGTTILVSVGL